MKKIAASVRTMQKASDQIRSLNHPTRYGIIELLRSKGKSTVTDIYTALKIEQSVTSTQLKIMRKSGVVQCERKGKFVLYSTDELRINDILSYCELLNDI